MMLQQVNLLEPGLLPKRLILDANHLAWGMGALVVVLTVYSIWQGFGIPSLRAAEAAQSQKLESVRVAGALHRSPLEDSTLLVEALSAKLSQQRALIASLQGHTNVVFSDYFIGLAHAGVKGVWLEEIDILHRPVAGVLVALRGQSIEAESIPRLLQSLSQEPVFNNYRFSDISIENVENVHRFSISTKEEQL